MAYIGKSPSGTGVRIRYYFTQTSGGATSISGTDDNNKTLSFSDGEYVDVYLNGVSLVAGTDYNTTTANTIGGLSALANGDVVEVVVYDIFTVADTVSQSSGGTFSSAVGFSGGITGSVNFSGNIDVDGTTTVDGLTSSEALDVTTSTHANASVFKSTGNTQIMLQDTDASANDQFWGLQVSGGDFNILTCNDDRASGFSTPFYITQAGLVTIAGTGIAIGGTGSANTLSDYEEGTWTPTDTSGAGLTFSSANGYYTKIGDIVVAAFKVVYPATSATNAASFGGLPFAGDNIVDSMYGGLSTFHSDTGTGPFSLIVGDNNPTFSVFYGGNSQRGVNNFTSGQFRGVLTYKTA